MFNFLKILPNYFPKWLLRFTFLPATDEGSGFSTFSPTLGTVSLLDYSRSSGCVVAPHGHFNFHFPNNWWRWALFHVFISHSPMFYVKVLNHIFCPFFTRLFAFCYCNSSLHILNSTLLYICTYIYTYDFYIDMWFTNIFSQPVACVFFFLVVTFEKQNNFGKV